MWRFRACVIVALQIAAPVALLLSILFGLQDEAPLLALGSAFLLYSILGVALITPALLAFGVPASMVLESLQLTRLKDYVLAGAALGLLVASAAMLYSWFAIQSSPFMTSPRDSFQRDGFRPVASTYALGTTALVGFGAIAAGLYWRQSNPRLHPTHLTGPAKE